MAESEDMVEVDPTVMEELGVCPDELTKIMEEELKRLEEVIQQKELENKCLKEVVQQRTYMCELHENAAKAAKKFELFVEDLGANLGRKYPETDSEEEDPSKPTEVIEIPDENEDDNNSVMRVDSADTWDKLAKDLLLLHEAFLDLKKSAEDIQKNLMDAVNKILPSPAMAESEDMMEMEKELEEMAFTLEKMKQLIDVQLEILKFVWRRYFGTAGKFHF